jgi:hypothetical protein
MTPRRQDHVKKQKIIPDTKPRRKNPAAFKFPGNWPRLVPPNAKGAAAVTVAPTYRGELTTPIYDDKLILSITHRAEPGLNGFFVADYKAQVSGSRKAPALYVGWTCLSLFYCSESKHIGGVSQ